MNNLIKFVGDLSQKDASLLASLATRATRILEFGAGGSTQLFAFYASEITSVHSVETDYAWIVRTKGNLQKLNIRKDVTFIHWPRPGNPLVNVDGLFDLVFVDGCDTLRRPFLEYAWERTVAGAVFAVHDTRRFRDISNLFDFVVSRKRWIEIDALCLNQEGSNITVMTRGIRRDYQDWNEVEGKRPWEYGGA